MSAPEQKNQRKLAAIMFTDIVGYSSLTQKNEQLALELLEAHSNMLRAIFEKFEGEEIKMMGDAFLVSFSSALEAVLCAVEIQKELFERNQETEPEKQIQVRIGLHLGDVVSKDNDVFGDGVNIASRIQPLAKPGSIFLSEDVARQILNKIEIPMQKLGKGELKNIKLPVTIYELVMPWSKKHLYSKRINFQIRNKTRWPAIGVLVMICVLAGFLFIKIVDSKKWIRPPQSTAQGLSTKMDRNRIAVLPFVNMSPDPQDEYFADGMTDEIRSALSKIDALRVIARTSSIKYKGHNERVSEIGRELQAGSLIDGSIRKSQDVVRVNVQLIDTQTEENLWSQVFDRKFEHIFKIQSDIAQSVAEALEVKFMEADLHEIEDREPENLEAYNFYLQGRFYWNKRTEDALFKSIELFEMAVARDPKYALAYAGLADAFNMLGRYNALAPKDSYPKAKKAALKALELDASLAQAHAALAFARYRFDWDWKGAEKEFKTAIRHNPNYASAHQWYANFLREQRRFDEAKLEINLAQLLDPLSLIINEDLGQRYYYARQYDLAIGQYLKSLEMDSNFLPLLISLGQAYEETGNYAEAVHTLQKATQIAQNRTISMASLAHAYAISGQVTEARQILDKLIKLSKEEYVSSYEVALIYVGLGETDPAFKWLKRAYEERDAAMTLLMVDPRLDPIRADARFANLLAKLKLDK